MQRSDSDELIASVSTIYFFNDNSHIFDMPGCFTRPYYIIRIFMNDIRNNQNIIKFKQNVYFTGTIFNKKVDFSYCTFNGTVNFNGSTFKESAEFNNVTFADKAYFMGVKFHNTVTFKDSNFDKKAYFDQDGGEPTEFKGIARFEAVRFKELVSFYGTKFYKNMNFFRTNFEDIANFNNVTFQQAFNFSNAYIDKIKFLGIQLGKNPKEDLSNFKEYFDDIKSNSLIKTKPKDNDEAITFSEFRRSCAIVKASLDKDSQKIDSNKFYSLELLAYEEELSKFTAQGFLQRVVLFFNKWSSNHGQSWAQALLWILAFGSLAGLLYASMSLAIVSIVFLYVLRYIKYDWLIPIILIPFVIYGLEINKDAFLNGFQIAIFPFYTSPKECINVWGICIVKCIEEKSMVFTLIINLIKVMNVYLLYQFVQAVRLNTRR